MIYRLPVPFAEQVVVGSRFYIRPLLPLLSGDGTFYLLALSQNHVRLWRGNRYRMEEVRVEDVPQSLAEVTQYDHVERVRAVHSIASSSTGRARRAVAFHGQGTASDEKLIKDSLRQFLQQVEKGVTALLADQRAPLVLAGVDYLCDLYRSSNQYRSLQLENLKGNPDRVSAEKLHQQAWRSVATAFQQERTKILARYTQWAGQHSPCAISGVSAVVCAAYEGRVDTLLLTTGDQAWGSFDPATGSVTKHGEAQPAYEELLNFALVHTLQTGGAAYAVEPHEVMDKTPVAALLRY
jgi:hypothetical protein